MTRFLMLACVGVAVITLAGCEKSTTPVAVVDLDKIGSGIGEIERINKQAKDEATQIRATLVAIQNNLNAQLKDFKEKAGPTPDEAKKKELAAQQAQARQIFDEQIRKARAAEQAVMKRRADAFSALRKQIVPIAEQIARKKGIDLVIANSGAVLWSNDSIDLTTEVLTEVNELRKGGQFKVTTQPAD